MDNLLIKNLVDISLLFFGILGVFLIWKNHKDDEFSNPNGQEGKEMELQDQNNRFLESSVHVSTTEKEISPWK